MTGPRQAVIKPTFLGVPRSGPPPHGHAPCPGPRAPAHLRRADPGAERVHRELRREQEVAHKGLHLGQVELAADVSGAPRAGGARKPDDRLCCGGRGGRGGVPWEKVGWGRGGGRRRGAMGRGLCAARGGGRWRRKGEAAAAARCTACAPRTCACAACTHAPAAPARKERPSSSRASAAHACSPCRRPTPPLIKRPACASFVMRPCRGGADCRGFACHQITRSSSACCWPLLLAPGRAWWAAALAGEAGRGAGGRVRAATAARRGKGRTRRRPPQGQRTADKFRAQHCCCSVRDPGREGGRERREGARSSMDGAVRVARSGPLPRPTVADAQGVQRVKRGVLTLCCAQPRAQSASTRIPRLPLP
jgi:hypothetical protein